MGVIADLHQDLSEMFDGISEAARTNADAAKRAALGALSPEKRDRLVTGLGAATSDQERCDVVAEMISDCTKKRDEATEELEDQNLEEFIDVSKANVEINSLQALLNELEKIKVFESLRDTFRAISRGLEAQGL